MTIAIPTKQISTASKTVISSTLKISLMMPLTVKLVRLGFSSRSYETGLMKIGNLTSSQGKVSPLVAVGTAVSSVWSTTLVGISGTKQSNKLQTDHCKELYIFFVTVPRSCKCNGKRTQKYRAEDKHCDTSGLNNCTFQNFEDS